MDKTINQQIEDLFLLHALDLEMLEVDQVISLRERFDDLRKRLVDLTVSADLMSGLPSSLDRRIGRVAKQAGEVIADFFEELTSESQSFMSDLAQAEASFGSTGFNTMLGTEYFGPTNNAENLAENLVVMGASIPDLFAAQSDALTRKYQQTITNAAKREFSNEQLISRIRGTASAKNMRITEEEIEDSGRVPGLTFASPITQRAQADASTVIITAMAALISDSSSTFISEHPEVFRGIQHKSILDLATSQICRTYADKCWDLQLRPILGNQLPYPGRPPLHFRCRSRHIPIIVPIQELPEALQNSMSLEARQELARSGNAIAESGSFNSWFKSIDPSVRVATIGRTLNAGFEKGLLTGSDLSNRKAGISINLKEYKQRVEKGFKK